MSVLDAVKQWGRPILLGACIPLLFAGLHPEVSDTKFQCICLLAALLFFFRGVIDKGFIERVVALWRGRAVNEAQP